MSPARTSRFRAALARPGGPALGTWVKLPVMESVELLALAGFDFVVIDLEHSAMNLETAYRLIGTANHLAMAPIVRIPTLDGGIAQRVLDAGAEGIMLPHVDTVGQAEAAARAVRFPPLGARGVGSTSRAGAWGAMDRAEYLRFGQEEVVLIAQIESAQAARSAGAIAAVDGRGRAARRRRGSVHLRGDHGGRPTGGRADRRRHQGLHRRRQADRQRGGADEAVGAGRDRRGVRLHDARQRRRPARIGRRGRRAGGPGGQW